MFSLRRALRTLLGEPTGHRNATLLRDPGQHGPELRRDPPTLPLVNRALCYRDCSFAHGVCQLARASEHLNAAVYEREVCHGWAENRIRCDLSSPFLIANESDAAGYWPRNPCPMSKKRDPENISSGERLAATRQYLYPNLTQWQFAEQWGVNHTTYNNWEIGKAPSPRTLLPGSAGHTPNSAMAGFGTPRCPTTPVSAIIWRTKV
jgi:DNA-binding XRE family transcriptional regulator